MSKTNNNNNTSTTLSNILEGLTRGEALKLVEGVLALTGRGHPDAASAATVEPDGSITYRWRWVITSEMGVLESGDSKEGCAKNWHEDMNVPMQEALARVECAPETWAASTTAPDRVAYAHNRAVWTERIGGEHPWSVETGWSHAAEAAKMEEALFVGSDSYKLRDGRLLTCLPDQDGYRIQ